MFSTYIARKVTTCDNDQFCFCQDGSSQSEKNKFLPLKVYDKHNVSALAILLLNLQIGQEMKMSNCEGSDGSILVYPHLVLYKCRVQYYSNFNCS